MAQTEMDQTETARPNGSDRNGSDENGSDRIGQTEKSCARSQPGSKLRQFEITNKCPLCEIDFLLNKFADGFKPFTTIGTSYLNNITRK